MNINPKTNRPAAAPSGGSTGFISWRRLTTDYLQRLEARKNEEILHLSINERGITFYVKTATTT